MQSLNQPGSYYVRGYLKLSRLFKNIAKSLEKTAIMSLAVIFVFSLFSVFSSTAQAANSWTGEEVVRSHHQLNLKPGAAITFIIKFKNTGTSPWYNITDQFVALATVDPAKRESPFKHTFWNEEPYRPARLSERVVEPGEVGTFRFALQAPDEVGDYEETFMAVAKGLSWIEGTKFTIPITVAEKLPEPIVVQSDPPAIPVVNQSNSESIPQDYPVRDDAYAASWTGGDVQSFNATPGQQILHTFKVKNAGSKTWTNSGSRFASLYTVRPNYHDSVFYSGGPGWIGTTQIRLASESVKPGETGEVVLMLQAPNQAGSYSDNIRLAVEDYSWMKSGELKIIINVEAPQVDDPVYEEGIYKHTEYEAQYLISSHRSIQISPGETVTFQVGFKNIGDANWRQSGSRYVSMYTIEPNYRASRFATVAAAESGWVTANQIEMVQSEVQPGQLAFFKFEIKAPFTSGSYTEKFRLAAEDYSWIKGGEFSLPITVENPTTAPPANNTPADPAAMGPIMRVGLFDSTEPFSITADTPFEVRTGSGQLLGSLPARTEVVVDYVESTGMYTVNSVSINQTLNDYIVIKAQDDNTIMEILSFERRLPWNPVVNENLFRGSIEIRHSDATDKTWAINILPMEQYLKGIAETSSESPVEFLKVMSVVARTYGFYHYERQSKHADENFYVDSTYDQVYRGYALEKRHPRLVEAVEQTAGEVVTYTDPATGQTKIAITPYYSRSDGRTRSWSEVWSGDVAWLQSVPVPHDVGQTLWGHGVGMSARGGLLMVVKDGDTYDQVIHYFFTGVNIEDRY